MVQFPWHGNFKLTTRVFKNQLARGEVMRRIFTTIAATAFLALAITAPARAQLPDTAMRAYIPFDFIVNGKTLPAGNYEVRRLTDEPEGLLIRSVNNKHEHAVFETEPLQENRMPRRDQIVFNRYGDTYFLSEVLTGGMETGRELPPTRAERQLKRETEMASNNAQPQTVSIALY
jgi:hypothetical protein